MEEIKYPNIPFVCGDYLPERIEGKLWGIRNYHDGGFRVKFEAPNEKVEPIRIDRKWYWK